MACSHPNPPIDAILKHLVGIFSATLELFPFKIACCEVGRWITTVVVIQEEILIHAPRVSQQNVYHSPGKVYECGPLPGYIRHFSLLRKKHGETRGGGAKG